MKTYTKIAVVAILFSLTSVASYFVLVQYFSRQEATQTKKNAAFFANTIDDALLRLWHLPFVISKNEIVVEALERSNGAALDPLLKQFSDSAGADHIFLMDINGKTVSASNYQSEDSFVGNLYTFRPYFRDALLGETGHFFAIGATTGEPGYFVSAPVRDRQGNIFGVVVVKTGLDALNRAWRDSGARILVSSADGVVLLASNSDDQFGVLQPLSPYARKNLENFQQFGGRPLEALDWQTGKNGWATLDGADYVLAEAKIRQEDWTLHLLSNLSGIRQRAALAAVGLLALLLGATVAVTGFRSTRLKLALGKSDADRMQLTREIAVRRAAEADLQTAQGELERNSRLAALGQLSASITHELGQPISAMRNHLVAEEIASNAAPGSLNPQLTQLVERMQNINNQLRFFATPRVEESSVFDLRKASDAAIDLVAHGVKAVQAALKTRYAEEPVLVSGNQQRVEQVLVNLLRNAIDAVEGVQPRTISVSVECREGQACVQVSDSGHGLGGRSLDNLQEPFVTTKPSGQGMGLGLSISVQIAKDMNGRIEAADGKTGGAVFTLWLPCAEDRK